MPKNKHMKVEITEIGTVIDIKEDVMTLEGLPSCVYGEILELGSGDRGMVVEFDRDKAVALLMSESMSIKTGDKAVSKGKLLTLPVSDRLIGRIVDGAATPVDGKGPIKSEEESFVFKDVPPIMDRVPISESLMTGIKTIDAVIPIGKGQRELIIGDRQTGKSSIAMDTIINQKDKDVICIYCWVGGSYSSMVKTVKNLDKYSAMDYTVFVAAPASVSTVIQYIAPYAAATIGEYFMDKKRDVLVVFDNLTKHAWIYRQLALLMNRSPGREAYPGDIFYIHSQLMERAGRLNPKIGGSMTFLPIVDTLQGDITGYIQTNLISMTDGQIYTSSSLFNEGFRPAIDIGLSVSRIGSKVQSPVFREVVRNVRHEYAQYRELQKLVQLRARITKELTDKINRGRTLTEILTQPANSPVSEIEQILLFYTFERGLLSRLNEVQLAEFKKSILKFVKGYNDELIEKLMTEEGLTDEALRELDETVDAYFKSIV